MSGLRKNFKVLPLGVRNFRRSKNAFEEEKERYQNLRQRAALSLKEKLYRFLENDEDFAILMADKDSYSGVKFEMRNWCEPDDDNNFDAEVLSIGYKFTPNESKTQKVLYFDGDEILCSSEESL